MFSLGAQADGTSIPINDRVALRDYILSNNYVSRLTGNEFAKSDEPLTDRVVKYYDDNYNGAVVRYGFGTVLLDKRGVKDSISHGIGRNKASAFAAVPEIIKSGALVDYQVNWKGRNRDSYTIVAPVEIASEGYVGVVVLARGKGTDRNKFYLHEVVLQKNLQEESIKTDTKADSHQGDIAKLLKEIVTAKKNGENIILNVKNELEVRGISIDNKGIPHLQSVAAIPQIIEKSIYISSVPNEDVQKNPNVVEYQHYVCGLKIGEEDYTVHALVGVDKNGNRYYDHNLVQIEKGKLLDHISGQAVITGFGTTPSTKLTTISNRKVNNLISILQVNDAEISSSRQRINEIAFRKAQDELEDRGISIDNRELLDNYGLSNLTLAKSGDHVTLSKIVAAEQGKGNGTRFMEDLARLADANGWTLALTPDTSFGGTSVSRLKKFYKRFGFKDNKGRNTDFKTRESMVRKPEKGKAGAAAKEAYREWKANEVDKKESSFGERSGVVSGNSSSEGLFRAGSEHLSRNAYPQRESDAKIQENTKYHYVRRKKSYDKGKKLLDYSKKRGKSLYSRHLLATMFYRSICHLHKSSSLSRPIWLQARKQGIHT